MVLNYLSAGDTPYKEKVNPLGQKINPHDPRIEAMGKSFFNQPGHCQKAAIERIDLQSLFPSTEDNPQGVSAPPGSTDGGSSGGGSEGMPVNPTTTSKPTGHGGSRSIDPSQMPSADGCSYDSDGRPSCAVKSEGSDENPIADNNAENGGGTGIRHLERLIFQRLNLLNFERSEKDKLIDNSLNFLSKNSNCETFLNDFLKELYAFTGITPLGNIKSLLEQFRERGKVSVYPNVRNAAADGQQIAGRWSFDFYRANHFDKNGEVNITANSNSEAIVFIHEVIHAVNTAFSDAAYARVGTKMGLTMSIEEFVEKYPREANSDLPREPQLTAARKLANRLLAYNCGGWAGGPPPTGIIKHY